MASALSFHTRAHTYTLARRGRRRDTLRVCVCRCVCCTGIMKREMSVGDDEAAALREMRGCPPPVRWQGELLCCCTDDGVCV